MKGVDNLLRNFDRVIADAQAALELAVKAGSLPILNAAKQKTPVRTGTLVRSEHIEITEKTKERVVAKTGTDLVYARRIEYGFVGKDSLGRNYNQAPHPYLRPAFDENIAKAKAIIAQVFRAAILKRRT